VEKTLGRKEKKKKRQITCEKLAGKKKREKTVSRPRGRRGGKNSMVKNERTKRFCEKNKQLLSPGKKMGGSEVRAVRLGGKGEGGVGGRRR